MNRDTKLIAILRRQYRIILTALGENILRIGRSHIFSPNQPSIYTSYSMVLHIIHADILLIVENFTEPQIKGRGRIQAMSKISARTKRFCYMWLLFSDLVRVLKYTQYYLSIYLSISIWCVRMHKQHREPVKCRCPFLLCCNPVKPGHYSALRSCILRVLFTLFGEMT